MTVDWTRWPATEPLFNHLRCTTSDVRYNGDGTMATGHWNLWSSKIPRFWENISKHLHLNVLTNLDCFSFSSSHWVVRQRWRTPISSPFLALLRWGMTWCNTLEGQSQLQESLPCVKVIATSENVVEKRMTCFSSSQYSSQDSLGLMTARALSLISILPLQSIWQSETMTDHFFPSHLRSNLFCGHK